MKKTQRTTFQKHDGGSKQKKKILESARNKNAKEKERQMR
jgi:hypothetical protein